MYDEMGTGCSIVALFVIVAIFAIYALLAPAMDGPHGSVVTVQQSETVSKTGVTNDGNVIVVALSSLASGIAHLAAALCSGGIVGWAGIILLTILGLAGIGAAAGR